MSLFSVEARQASGDFYLSATISQLLAELATEVYEALLWESGTLGLKTPQALLNAVFDIGSTCCKLHIRGAQAEFDQLLEDFP